MNLARATFALVLLSGLLYFAPQLSQASSVGDQAPDFSLKNSNGDLKRLAQYRGKIVLINFWASWCAPCQSELPKLNELAARHKGRLQVLAINVDNEKTLGQKSLARLGLSRATLEVLWDNRSKAVSAYNPPTLPSSYLIDARGKIRFIHEGFRPEDPRAWDQEIQTLSH